MDGQRIGQAVSAALNAALPGVGALVDLLWPNRKKDSDEVRKEDLIAAGNEKGVIQLQKEAAQAALRVLSQLVAELTLLNRFLIPTSTAHLAVVAMIASSDLGSKKTHWKVAKAQLEKLRDIKEPDLVTARDIYLRDILAKILRLIDDAVLRVDSIFETEPVDIARLHKDGEAMAQVLAAVTEAVGYELDDLRRDLASMVAVGSKTLDEPNLFKNRINARLSV